MKNITDISPPPLAAGNNVDIIVEMYVFIHIAE
jgi:hypothetical protein